MTFFVVKRAANHYWFTALSSSHVCTIKEMKQTYSLVYAGIHVYLHLLCPPCTYHIVNPFTCSFLYIGIIVSITNLIIKFWTSLEKSKVPPATTPMLIFSLRTIFILCSGFKRWSILIQIIRHLSQF